METVNRVEQGTWKKRPHREKEERAFPFKNRSICCRLWLHDTQVEERKWQEISNG